MACTDAYLHVPRPLCESTQLWEMDFRTGAEVCRLGIRRAPKGSEKVECQELCPGRLLLLATPQRGGYAG